MNGYERGQRVMAVVTMPAVFSELHKDWQYSAIRFVITETADKFVVSHVLSVVRS